MLALGVGNAWAETSSQVFDFTSGTTMPAGVVNSGGVAFATTRFCFDTKNDNIVITPTIPTNTTSISIVVKGLMNSTSANAGIIGVYGLSSNGSNVANASGTFTQSRGSVNNASTVDSKTVNETEIKFSADNVAKVKINCDTYSKKYIIRSVTITYEISSGETPDPTPTKLTAPENLKEASIAETSATLSWDAVANASNYNVTINGNTETVTTNSYSATGLTAGTEYTWSVVAKGDGTNYTDSDAAQHTFSTTAATTPDPEPGTGGEETWTLVTNASDLKAGDQIVIAATESDYALGTTQNTNNRVAVGVTKGTNTITIGDDVQIITLETGKVANTFAFNTGSAGYLYAASSTANNLKTKTTLDDNGSWAISITSEGVATIKAQGTSTRNWIRKNSSSAIFSCYGSGQSDVAIYKKVTSSGGSDPETPAASLTANPTSLDFGNVTQNNEVEAKTFTISGSDFTTGELTITAPSGYTVNPTTVTVNGTLEETTITVTPNTSAVGTFNGNVTISGANLKSSVNVALSMTVEKAFATPTDNVYVKVTTTAGITDGEYLIVYEDETAPIAFNGALATLDAAKNTVAVGISNSTIAGNTDIDAALFTIDVTAGTLKSASGKYIGVSSNNNGLKTEDVAKDYKNAFSVDDNGNAVIAADFEGSTMSLRYNNTAGDNNLRFRYYKNAGQQPIALYKKASKHTVTIAVCTNGSVSAKMGETALATDDQVLSGTQITLGNEAVTNYKLAAYDVYKTGDNTTKVTVTDGKFIMPEFDVTISATFELAKTLTGIEITNDATQTTFWQGETFNHNGLKVTAHFDGAEDEDVTDKVTVTGSTATAGAAVEVTVSFTEGTTTETTEYDITVKATANTTETAYDVATAREIIDKVSSANDIYVQGIVSKIVTAYNSTYGNITYDISADGLTTSVQLQAYRGKSFNGDPFTSADDVKVGDEVVVFGNLLKYNSTYELAENNKLISLNRNKAVAGLAYETKEYTAKVNEAFSTPVLTNPNSLTVTYSSSDENLATVDATTGAVTILDKTGKVTITATFDGNAAYLPGTASYNITITDPNQFEATFVAADDKGNTTQGEGEITKSPITFACSDGILGNGEEYRIYAYAKAIFSAAEGYIITKVVLTSTASDDSKYGPAKLSTEDGTYTYSGKEGTWVGEAYTVTLTASAQTRATLITVYYKQDNRVDAGLAWNPATVSLTVGDAFTAPTFSNPNSLAVSFESSNTELATVDNAGAILLVSGKTGTATITATYAGNETYKPAEVTCVITVSPKSEKVVILAEYNGQWYALKNVEQTADKVLAALPVNYVGGKLYNVADADKATIEWQLAIDGTIATFKNGENYISGTAGSADMKLATIECEWTYDGSSYMIGNRTFLYRAQANGFKNYNAEDNAGTGDYSELPVVTAPVYDTAIEIGSGNNSIVITEKQGQKVNVIVDRAFEAGDEWYTLCVPFNMDASVIGKAYELGNNITGHATGVQGGINISIVETNSIVAGKPYLIKPNITVNKLVVENVAIDNTTASSHVAKGAGVKVTFTGIINGVGEQTDGEIEYYVGDEGKLYNGKVDKLGLRAFFTITDEAGNKVNVRARVVAGENVETGVEDIITTDAPVKVIENGQLIIIRDGVKYNVQGVRL